jgi:hypothetical protein
MASMERSEHVVPHPLGWAVKSHGEEEYHFTTKEQAIEKARNLAKANGTNLVIHGRDGRVQKNQSYG